MTVPDRKDRDRTRLTDRLAGSFIGCAQLASDVPGGRRTRLRWSDRRRAAASPSRRRKMPWYVQAAQIGWADSRSPSGMARCRSGNVHATSYIGRLRPLSSTLMWRNVQRRSGVANVVALACGRTAGRCNHSGQGRHAGDGTPGFLLPQGNQQYYDRGPKAMLPMGMRVVRIAGVTSSSRRAAALGRSTFCSMPSAWPAWPPA